jgi:hypothetical protein
MLNIKFPIRNTGNTFHRFYNIHYNYFLRLLTEAGCKIEMVSHGIFDNYSETAFEIYINGVLVAIDFSDHLKLSVPEYKISKYKAIFKFHYLPERHSMYSNIYPVSPVSFHDWGMYKRLKPVIHYTASGSIMCKQIPRAAAKERRDAVQSMLQDKYKNKFDSIILDEESFYKSINSTMVAVCVPGARNNMLDRGQGQYMAFGTCTISPRLVTVLSSNQLLVPGTHYIECKPDYSDVVEKIEWVRSNPEKAIQIGKNAKQIFEKTSLPKMQVEWINKCLKNE